MGNHLFNYHYVCPIFKPKLKTLPIVKKEVRIWNENACEKLRGCFDCTNWSIFHENCSDLDTITNVVSDYIVFCEELCSDTKIVECFPNNKPWVTTDLKELLN